MGTKPCPGARPVGPCWGPSPLGARCFRSCSATALKGRGAAALQAAGPYLWGQRQRRQMPAPVPARLATARPPRSLSPPSATARQPLRVSAPPTGRGDMAAPGAVQEDGGARYQAAAPGEGVGKSQWSGRAGRGFASTPQPGRVAGRSRSPGHGPPGARGSGQAWPLAWATLAGMGEKAAPGAYLCHGPALPGDGAGRRRSVYSSGAQNHPAATPAPLELVQKPAGTRAKLAAQQHRSPFSLSIFHFALNQNHLLVDPVQPRPDRYMCCFKCICQKGSC